MKLRDIERQCVNVAFEQLQLLLSRQAEDIEKGYTVSEEVRFRTASLALQISEKARSTRLARVKEKSAGGLNGEVISPG